MAFYAQRQQRSLYNATTVQGIYLEASKTAATGKANIADIRGAVRRDHFVNDQRSVPQVGPSGQLHLPELLQSFHHVH